MYYCDRLGTGTQNSISSCAFTLTHTQQERSCCFCLLLRLFTLSFCALPTSFFFLLLSRRLWLERRSIACAGLVQPSRKELSCPRRLPASSTMEVTLSKSKQNEYYIFFTIYTHAFLLHNFVSVDIFFYFISRHLIYIYTVHTHTHTHTSFIYI